MKNRKVIVTAFLLVAVMLLGVGYAAVSDTLNFNGDATISNDQVQQEFDLDVKIAAVSEDNVTWIDYQGTEAEIHRPDDLIVGISGTDDNVQDTASFQIYNLADQGEQEVIWFKVTNDSAFDADLTKSDITEVGTHDFFGAEYTIYAADGTTETAVLPANGEVLIKLVITLKDTPAESYQGNFSFTVVATVAGNT